MAVDVFADGLNQLIADENLSYDKIKVKLQKKYIEQDKKTIIEELYTSVGHKDDLTFVMPPIHYLFDKYISNIGNTYENVDLFSDYITTDALDYAITETPIENQFLNEVGTCKEEESLANKIEMCVKHIEESLDSLGSSLDDKYAFLKDLEDKIALQEKVLAIMNTSDEDDDAIFVV